MRVLILGGDGYLGWPTAMYLSRRGHEVAVVDNYFRRRACTELNCEPLIAVPNLHQRAELWQAVSGNQFRSLSAIVCDYQFFPGSSRNLARMGWCIMPNSLRPLIP